MRKDQNAEAVKLAGDHWNWLVLLLQKVYVDAFVHGYKHGYEDGKRKR